LFRDATPLLHLAVAKLSNSRDQVEAELRAWQTTPVTPDGLRYVPGEIGWVEAR
jgi:hypothetical protein